jgi:hypothetical protein
MLGVVSLGTCMLQMSQIGRHYTILLRTSWEPGIEAQSSGLHDFVMGPRTLSLSFMDSLILTMLQMSMIDAASLGAVRSLRTALCVHVALHLKTDYSTVFCISDSLNYCIQY